jgi:hypothetical protein
MTSSATSVPPTGNGGRVRSWVSAAVLALLVAALAVVATARAPHARATAAGAGSLAAANAGKSAGYCAYSPSTNTLGGNQFETSCDGHLGTGMSEYWCADFAKWVWRHSGFNVSGLSAAAASFDTYGSSHGSFRSTPAVGDAITFSKTVGGTSHHVGIVTAVNSDGSFAVANGDWGGSGSSESSFGRSSAVRMFTVPASQAAPGSYVSVANRYLHHFIAPSTDGGSGQTGTGNPYTAAGLCGSGYGVVDSHHITGATIYLLYNGDNGNNCVATLADADTGAVSMNATLAVQGGTSGSDPGSYHWYAGPVVKNAPDSCVKWGGSYKTATWTSDWGHCGSGGGSPAPTEVNPYSAEDICGSGYDVIDSHGITGAMIYLLYNDATGKNCTVTLASDAGGAVSMSATLSVQNGSASSDSGSYAYYAGPVRLYAPSSCVKWGGSYKSSSWTSDWGHCGGASSGGSTNPYTPTGVCGTGYSVIDSHNLGSATVYLLYKSGYNCVATLVHSGSRSVGLNATLAVQGGSSKSDPGLYEWYAGPVRLYAASACVKWGGSYEDTSWTSAWSHCG